VERALPRRGHPTLIEGTTYVSIRSCLRALRPADISALTFDGIETLVRPEHLDEVRVRLRVPAGLAVPGGEARVLRSESMAVGRSRGDAQDPDPPGQSALRRVRGAELLPMKKFLRTLQVNFPYLLDAKFSVMRVIRNTLKVPFEDDFNALSLFPPVDNALFLDVGANRGQSTDAILMKQKNIRIELFEPNELLYDKLKDLFGGDDRMVIHNFGLGDEVTEGTLFVPFYKKWMFDGLASFNEEEAAGWLKGRMFLYSDRLLTIHKSKCKIETLDRLDLAPFFIKLDVQGYEYKALKGGEKTIKKHEPVLLIETPDHKTTAFLKSLGYQLYAYRDGKFIPGVKGALNTFFMTEGKSSLVRSSIGS
jgi:FkbM family methyltransferase